MKATARVEANRRDAKCQGLGNVILNALYQVYGDLDTAYAQYEVCLTSPRFGTLLAIAGHGQSAFARLQVAATKIANNPATRAQI